MQHFTIEKPWMMNKIYLILQLLNYDIYELISYNTTKDLRQERIHKSYTIYPVLCYYLFTYDYQETIFLLCLFSFQN